MRRRVLVGLCVVGMIVAAQNAAFAFTFSIDQGPAGSVPPYNDGTLLVYTTSLGPTPSDVRDVFVNMPVDALHIGTPVKGLLTGDSQGSRVWTNVTLAMQGLVFSIDHGDPFPVGISPDSNEEMRTVWKIPSTSEYITSTTMGVDLGLIGDFSTAIETNLGLNGGAAFDDDVDALDTSTWNSQVDPVFFSVDDSISLVPNLPAGMGTGDIYVRFPDGGIAKAIDAVLDLGLRHDGDSPNPIPLRFNDDIDALIIVELDDDETNNIKRTVSYTNPITGQVENVEVDLGDGIMFSLDRDTDLPYQNGGLGPEHLRASQGTQYVYFSSLGGLSSLQAVVSNEELGLSMGTIPDDIDALGFGHAPIPEPGTWLLLGTAAISMVGLRIRKRMRS